ncbi:hypothetical protein BABINDRAFT_159043 [Babjeviella inositovora NRRL Y-12698]|uniref:G-patch domain-containing protein n=1 Tax=Babjeviella inositovora NRRL Y-12698 TaxID=984486 RepID=A0A1E3QXZ8_9ASCO|nr:uncharacterized protein BABINDRAFT_159043 [Babjeviella inositovora NRRL Y-12698]ODQ82454.1 hypothetical protein BABINDRAFT_159043 [Babjeviella inositovora NRRL Y-12698]
MNGREYLKSYGWKEGEALRKGGLRKPILVKHKKDTKGLGHDAGDSEAWWERLFDGQLKSLEVNASASKGKDGAISFNQNKVVASGVSKQQSPLYRMFVKGEGLAGTVGRTDFSRVRESIVVLSDDLVSQKFNKGKKQKEGKKDNKEKKEKKGKSKKSEIKKKEKKEKKKKKKKKERKVKEKGKKDEPNSGKRKRDSDEDKSKKKKTKV